MIYGPNLSEYRQLLKKIVVMKNTHLDQLCNLKSTTGLKIISTDLLEEHINKVSRGSSSATAKFSTKKDETQVTFPIGTILSRTDAATDWVCVQASFMKANPVAGQAIGAQYYYQNQFIVQVGSLDSEGERLVD